MQWLKTTQQSSYSQTLGSLNSTFQTLLVVIFLCLPSVTFANTSKPTAINVWHKNQRVASTFEFVELALSKADAVVPVQIKTIVDNDAAYEALSQANPDKRLDIMVAGVSESREAQFLPVYVPLDRGLLGFRVCIIAPQQQQRFNVVNQVSDFAQKALRIALVSDWPDVDIMTQNQIPVITGEHYHETVNVIKSNAAECFSRSVIEIGAELESLPELAEENHIAMVYPFADIIYVNPNNPELHQQLQTGLHKAIEDRSFYELHERHYQQLLMEHQFYARKLLIMENPNLSDAAREAINRYGIASFSRLKR